MSGFDDSDIGILRYCLKTLYGHDCDELAETLAERFGGVSKIFSAPYEQIVAVRGVTPRVASFLASMLPLGRQAMLRSCATRLDSEKMLVEFAAVYFLGMASDIDVCICLDGNGNISCVERLTRDNKLRETIGLVCRHNAQYLIILHHAAELSDGNTPTAERAKFIGDMERVLRIFDIRLVDYIECAGGLFYSMRGAESGKDRIRHINAAAPAVYELYKLADKYAQ